MADSSKNSTIRIDPNAALLTRTKLRKAGQPRKKGKPKATPSVDPAGPLSPELHRLSGEALDSLSEKLFAALPPSDASTLGGVSTPADSGSLSQIIGSLGDDMKAVTKCKRNRHKERLARRTVAHEEARDEARKEVESVGPQPDYAAQEERSIQQACADLGVSIFNIVPDGHCLYSAIAHQLNLHQAPATPFTITVLTDREIASSASSHGPHTYKSCRKSAAAYMRSHPDEFLPYLPAQDEGAGEGVMDASRYARHCDLVENSGEWGGQPEVCWSGAFAYFIARLS